MLVPLKECLSRKEMQEAIDRVSQAWDNYDIKFSTKTTEVVYQLAPGSNIMSQPSQ